MMKTLKLKFTVLFAVLFALMAMSFQFTADSPVWYEVEEADHTGKNPIGDPLMGNPEDHSCQTLIPDTEICAVRFEGQPSVAYVQDLTIPHDLAWTDEP